MIQKYQDVSAHKPLHQHTFCPWESQRKPGREPEDGQGEWYSLGAETTNVTCQRVARLLLNDGISASGTLQGRDVAWYSDTNGDPIIRERQ